MRDEENFPCLTFDNFLLILENNLPKPLFFFCLDIQKTKKKKVVICLFVNDCELSLASKQINISVLPRKILDFSGWEKYAKLM